jgi:hypothetical protein
MKPEDHYDPAGVLSDAELAWANNLALCGQLGWHVVGRDALGQLVAATIVSAGRSAPDSERYCTITLTPAGLVHGEMRWPRARDQGS